MREAKFTKLLTIALSVESYQRVKEITDRERISMAQWYRDLTDKALTEVGRDEPS